VDLPEYTIEELEAQETLEFASMTNEDAVRLGEVAIEVIREIGLSLCVEIVVGGDTLFLAKLGSTGAGNTQWLKRKAATANHFGTSSLLLKRQLERDNQMLDDLSDDHEALAAHGGAVPIRVGGEMVGTITMSGEPDWVDHAAVIAAITRYQAPQNAS
jgi:uncharacterized protein (UPF0303 family)